MENNSYLKMSLFHFSGVIVIIIFYLLLGCSFVGYDLSRASNLSWQTFKNIPNEDLFFKKTIYIKDLIIVIEGSQDEYAKSRGAIGYAEFPNKIWIRGSVIKGKIIPFETGLGHELTHILNFVDSEIVNPDRISELLMK